MSGASRRRRQARPTDTAGTYELRASVTQQAYALLGGEAESLGRSRTWHCGMILEAYARIAARLSGRERADFDRLLRAASEEGDIEPLLMSLRPALRPAA